MPIFRRKPRLTFRLVLPPAILVCLAPLLPLILAPPASTASVAGAYAVLVTDAGTPDRLAAQRLRDAGFDGAVSESSQWYFVNSFDGVRRVPLDEDALLEGDPRDDGYARKARALFVRGGKRYLYIPRASLRTADGEAAVRRVAAALGDIPHSLAFSGYTGGSGIAAVFVFALSAALGLALVLRAAKDGSASDGSPSDGGSPDASQPFLFAALLPSLGLFASLGPAGFALAALAAVLFQTVRQPLKDCFIELQIQQTLDVRKLRSRVRRALSTEGSALIFILALSAAVCVTGRLAAGQVLSAVLLFCASVLAIAGAETAPRKGHHVPFVPVSIRGKTDRRKRAWAALPFTLGSAAAFVIPLLFGAPVRMEAAPRLFDGRDGVPSVSAADYEAHIAYQNGFARRKLGGGDAAYMSYGMGEDGFFSPDAPISPVEQTPVGITAGEETPFPLEGVLRFLAGSGAEGIGEEGSQASAVVPAVFDGRGLAAIIISLAVYLPALASGNGKRRRSSLYLAKQAEA
jgi:hypothetical protein